MTFLPKDTELQFPHVIVIPASAGSGKTYTLAHRYVQFLLSPSIPDSGLRNILAITFTKLAAKEMKERILNLLKEAALNDGQTVNRLSEIVSMSDEEIVIQSQQMINRILSNYSDFNIRTIDSFLTTVFKASSLELGVQPDVDIEFNNDAVIDRAFRQFSQQMREGSDDARFIDELVSLIESNESSSKAFLWNPFTKIIREVRLLQNQFAKFSQDPVTIDHSFRMNELKRSIVGNAGKLQNLLKELELPAYHYFANDIVKLAEGDVFGVAKKQKWAKYFNKFKGDEESRYKRNENEIILSVDTINRDLEEYIILYSQHYYRPFVRAVTLIEKTIKEVKVLDRTVIMDDINRSLSRYLTGDIVPEVYFKLGERIAHFMIDEFQDTSPIQWMNLSPLIEEALSKGGSMLAVGDTKQSIYSFRGADWHIFKNLIDKKYFPSAPATTLPLEMNFRSSEHLVNFVKKTFTVNVAAAHLQAEAEASRLYNFGQDVPETEKGKGYVEVKLIEKSEDDAATTTIQRTYVTDTINDCISRGYSFGDVAVLTPSNADVVEISSWLNSKGIPFLSLSTLDIRKRKIVGELIALLRFLDSPIDNLSFATFVFGDLFQKIMLKEDTDRESSSFRQKQESIQSNFGIHEKDGKQGFAFLEDLHSIFLEHPKEYLYRTFHQHYPELWGRYFDRLFALVGYMPLYDLVSETYKTFSVFECSPLEESSLVKLLECVKKFENSGNNSLKDFLSFSNDENIDEWSIDIPSGINAVRLMTIHKAKGLGFPVVLVFLKEKRVMMDSRVMIEQEDGLSLYRVTKDTSSRHPVLAELHAAREREQTIDELNKLYVALTRARQEMYVVSTYKKIENLPASILPEGTVGEKYRIQKKIESIVQSGKIEPQYKTKQTVLQTAQYEKIGLQETRRGDYIHNILSNIACVSENLSSDIRNAMKELIDETGLDKEKEESNLVQFLSLPDVAEYFHPKKGRTIYQEKEIVASGGRLFRMDRVVVDESDITVIDFKTGVDEKADHYKEQVRNYMQMLKELFPQKSIHGMLLYIDLRKAVTVE